MAGADSKNDWDGAAHHAAAHYATTNARDADDDEKAKALVVTDAGVSERWRYFALRATTVAMSSLPQLLQDADQHD